MLVPTHPRTTCNFGSSSQWIGWIIETTSGTTSSSVTVLLIPVGRFGPNRNGLFSNFRSSERFLTAPSVSLHGLPGVQRWWDWLCCTKNSTSMVKPLPQSYLNDGFLLFIDGNIGHDSRHSVYHSSQHLATIRQGFTILLGQPAGAGTNDRVVQQINRNPLKSMVPLLSYLWIYLSYTQLHMFFITSGKHVHTIVYMLNTLYIYNI